MFANSEQKCFRVLPFLFALIALPSTIAHAANTSNSSSFSIPAKDANVTAINPVTVAKRNQATVRNIAPKPEGRGMSFSARMGILASVLGFVAFLFLTVWIIHVLRRRSKMKQTITPADNVDEEENDSKSIYNNYNREIPDKKPSLKQFESRMLEEFERADAKLQDGELAYDTKHDERSEMAQNNGPASRADLPNKTGLTVPMNNMPKYAARSAPLPHTGDDSKMAPLHEQKQTSLVRGDRNPAGDGSSNASDKKTTQPSCERAEFGESQRSTDGNMHDKKQRGKKKNQAIVSLHHKQPEISNNVLKQPKQERRGPAKMQSKILVEKSRNFLV